MQREDPAIDHRIAAEAIGDPPAEGLAIVFPRQVPAEGLGPLVMSFIGAVDLGGDRQLVPPGGRHVKIDRPPVLQPSIRIDPKIHLIAREMTRQKRPRHLRLQGLRCPLAIGEIEIPARPHNMVDPPRRASRAARRRGPRSRIPIGTSGRHPRSESTVSRSSGKYRRSAPLTIRSCAPLIAKSQARLSPGPYTGGEGKFGDASKGQGTRR